MAWRVKNTFIDDIVPEVQMPPKLTQSLTTPAKWRVSERTTVAEETEPMFVVLSDMTVELSNMTVEPDGEVIGLRRGNLPCEGCLGASGDEPQRPETLGVAGVSGNAAAGEGDMPLDQDLVRCTTMDPFECNTAADQYFLDFSQAAALPPSNLSGCPAPPVDLSDSNRLDSTRASAPAQLKPGKAGYIVEPTAGGGQLFGWTILQTKLKPGFGQHLSSRMKCKLRGKDCEIMMTMKEVPALGAGKESSRRDRRNQAGTTCTIEVRLLSGLEEHPDGIFIYFVSIGSGTKRTEPRRETHDFKKANTSRGQKDTSGSMEWKHMEAFDAASQTLLVCLELLP